MRTSDLGTRPEPKAILRISIADMMALRVRAKGSNNAVPQFLYQLLPTTAMTLIDTIPSGTSAVSIPQQNGRYPISEGFPEIGAGFAIVYARKPNGRYEAVEVLHRAESFEVGQFCKVACRWVETNMDGLQFVPGKYAYFAPTRDQLGVILRDGGFTIFDPTAMAFEITTEIRLSRNDPSSSGVIARIPVQAAYQSGGQSHVPVFSRIELAPDPDPGPASLWIPFVDWQRLRAIRSRPPDLIIPYFRDWLSTLTRETGFESWNLRKGMFFGDHIEWWGDQNRRRTLHEGIDFCEGFLPDATVQRIPEGTPVRSFSSGDLVAVLDDFLNKTFVVRHSHIRDENGDILHTFFSHIHPETSTHGPLTHGQLLGKVAKSRNIGTPAHLHLTGAWIPESIKASEITMDLINLAYTPIVLINFNSLLSGTR